MKHQRFSWTLLILILLWVSNSIIWSPKLPYLNYQHLNSQMLIIQLSQSITILASLTIVMLIGEQLSRYPVALTNSIKMWLYTVGLLLGSLVAVWLVANRFNYHNFYHALLPIVGNTVPLSSSMIIGILILPLLRRYIKKAPFTWGTGILIIFAINTFFNHDVFGLLNGQSVTFYLLVMLLGIVASTIKVNRHSLHKWTLGFAIINSYLVLVMPNASYFTRDSFATANRFSTPASLTMVATAMGLYLILRPYLLPVVNHLAHPLFWFLTLSVMVENPVTLQIIINHAKASFELWYQLLWALAWGVSVLTFAYLLPPLFNYCQQRFNINTRLIGFWTTNPTKPFDEQLVIIYNRIEDWFLRMSPTILALGISYLLALFSIYLMGRPSLFVKQSMVWFNTFLIFLIFRLIQSIFNRYWLALITTIIINGVWIVANMQKMMLRHEPIMPSELAMINNLDSLLKMVNPGLVIVCLVIILICLVITVILEYRFPGPKLSRPSRIIWIILAIATFSSSFYWNHHRSRINTLVSGWGDIPHFINQSAGALRNGPLVQFLNNVDITIMNQPSGYSAKEMQRISHHYTKISQEINLHRNNDLANQTVIFNLSESFADPRRVPGITLKNNPIPNIERIKANTTSGIMLSSGYGGGTANMEYMTLTGFAMCNFAQTLSTPYTQLVPYLKHNPTIVNSFKYAAAIHPYSKKFYDRGIDYPKFGFNSFSYLGSKKHPITHQKRIDANTYLSDQTAYINTLNQLQRHHGPQFINLVTMQNHLPYSNLYRHLNRYHVGVGKEKTIPSQVENYAMGLHYTDQAVANFIKEIDQINRPITLVFYGDHLPGIYRNSMQKDGLKLHETDYFIYSNPAAKRQGAHRLTKQAKYVGPNDFIAMTAEQTNSKVTPYQALLTQLYQKLPAYTMSTNRNGTNSFNAAPEFVNQQGKVVSFDKLTTQQQQLWHDYQLVQYDLTAGHQYLLKTNMMK